MSDIAISAEFAASPIIPGGTTATSHDAESNDLVRLARTFMYGQTPKSRLPEAKVAHANEDREEITRRVHMMNRLAQRGYSQDVLRDLSIKWGWS